MPYKAHCVEKTWHNLQNRKYKNYRHAASGGPSHGYSQHAEMNSWSSAM